jgi:hypothetical protein
VAKRYIASKYGKDAIKKAESYFDNNKLGISPEKSVSDANNSIMKKVNAINKKANWREPMAFNKNNFGVFKNLFEEENKGKGLVENLASNANGERAFSSNSSEEEVYVYEDIVNNKNASLFDIITRRYQNVTKRLAPEINASRSR